MRSIPLQIDETGCRFNLDLPVLKDFAATVQEVQINLGTARGSDPVFVNRGTYLQQDGAQGRMVNGALAQHSANFASLDTLVFCRSQEMPSQTDQLQRVDMQVVGLRGRLLALAVQVSSARGEVVGKLFAV